MTDTLTVQAGRTFEVVLRAFGGTGYSWEWVPPLTLNLKPVHETRMRVDAVETPSHRAEPVAGGLMEYRFEFAADFAGTAQLEFVLTRPWENERPWEVPANRRHSVTVTVVPPVARNGAPDRDVA